MVLSNFEKSIGKQYLTQPIGIFSFFNKKTNLLLNYKVFFADMVQAKKSHLTVFEIYAVKMHPN